MGNTNIHVPMSEMNITQQRTTAPPTLGNNLLSFNSSTNSAVMSPLSWHNAQIKQNGEKPVALSAQEINDFLT